MAKRPLEQEVHPTPPTVLCQDASASSVQPLGKARKRDDCIVWDDYFMAIAFLSAMRSKDPSTQVPNLRLLARTQTTHRT